MDEGESRLVRPSAPTTPTHTYSLPATRTHPALRTNVQTYIVRNVLACLCSDKTYCRQTDAHRPPATNQPTSQQQKERRKDR
mmetsp:Transcript_19091/g.54776  ORF Transcript_19091/g.54776 Transcript_19091/m.54776 type:complete len:82 (+) Transcript_19091:2444-2689(+)